MEPQKLRSGDKHARILRHIKSACSARRPKVIQYKEAANTLNVSVNTIRTYVRSIYDKLHVHSKTEAVRKALRQGIID